MGILDNLAIKKAMKIDSTKGFYFGATEAEAENVGDLKLSNYFDDYLDILENLQIGKFIFTGRKGVGKSAIAKYIKDTSDDSDDSFAKILRFSDFELEKIIQKSEVNHELERLFFEWLILVNVVKLIIRNECGLYTTEYSKLQKFLDVNSGLINIDEQQIDAITKQTGGEVKFGMLTHLFEGVFKRYFGVSLSKAPFYKMINPLKEVVKIILDYEVNKNNEFWILFDDLDIYFNPESAVDNNRIMELVRLAKTYNNEIFVSNKARIVLFLRDDMKQSVVTKFPDSAKIFSSYEIPINWYDHDLFLQKENQIPLKKMLNKRVELNFKSNNRLFNISDPWYSLFAKDNYSDNQYRNSFKYIADFTFYRPRDFITFMSLIGQTDYTYPLSKSNVKKILEKYIPINISEIKSELSLYFNETEKDLIFSNLFQYLIDNQNTRYDKFISVIGLSNFRMSNEKVFEILNSYSLIVFRENSTGKLFFNYRENPEIERIGLDNMSLTLPKCIYHYYRPII